MNKFIVIIAIIFLVGCDGDRQGGWDTNKYELKDKTDGSIYFASNYLIECQDALVRLKVCDKELAKNAECRYNPEFKHGGMAVDNIKCGRK